MPGGFLAGFLKHQPVAIEGFEGFEGFAAHFAFHPGPDRSGRDKVVGWHLRHKAKKIELATKFLNA